MIRILAIFLLFIQLFNSVGYRVLAYVLEQKADFLLEARLDARQYDEAALVEIKIPIGLPYHTDWKYSERIKGEIELNGVHYKYVERKVAGGFLVLLCLPDPGKVHFENTRDRFFDLVNNLKIPVQKKETSNLFKNLMSEYLKADNSPIFSAFFSQHNRYFIANTPACLSKYLNKQEKPPELAIACKLLA